MSTSNKIHNPLEPGSIHCSLTLMIAPEMTALLNDILSIPSALVPRKYGPLGDSFSFAFPAKNNQKALLELLPSYTANTLSETEPFHGTLTITSENGEQLQEIKLSAKELSEALLSDRGIAIKKGHIRLNIKADEASRRIGNRFLYQANCDDPHYKKHDGELCTILRALTPKECDIMITGLMWEAKFPDNDIMHIFDEELQPAREPLSQQIKNATSQKTIQAAPQDSKKDQNR